MLIRCIISNNNVEGMTLLPVDISKTSELEILLRKDERFDEVVNDMREITESAGLNAKDTTDGQEAERSQAPPKIVVPA